MPVLPGGCDAGLGLLPWGGVVPAVGGLTGPPGLNLPCAPPETTDIMYMHHCPNIPKNTMNCFILLHVHVHVDIHFFCINVTLV